MNSKTADTWLGQSWRTGEDSGDLGEDGNKLRMSKESYEKPT